MTNKLKPLPSLREKKRYVVFEVISEKELKINSIKEAIKKSLLNLIGIINYAKSNPHFLDDKYDKKNKRGIIRINHKHADDLKASFTLIKSIDNAKVIVRSIGVSGILKKAEAKYFK